MALSKIIGQGYLLIRQGRATLDLMDPLSRHNQIGMTESKLPRIETLKREVWRITVGIVAILFLTCLVVKYEASDKATKFIVEQYDNSNGTQPHFSVDMYNTFIAPTNSSTQDFNQTDSMYPYTAQYSPQWNPGEMTKEEAVAFVNLMIGYVVLAIFVYSLMFLLFC